MQSHQLGKNGFRLVALAGGRIGPGQILFDLLILGRIFDGDFQGENGGLGQFAQHGRLPQKLVGRRAVRIAIEDLLGDFQGIHRLLHQGQLASGQQRLGPGTAPYFFEKSAAAARFLELRRAQRFAAIIKTRLLLEDLVKDGDGVIKVLAVEG